MYAYPDGIAIVVSGSNFINLFMNPGWLFTEPAIQKWFQFVVAAVVSCRCQFFQACVSRHVSRSVRSVRLIFRSVNCLSPFSRPCLTTTTPLVSSDLARALRHGR